MVLLVFLSKQLVIDNLNLVAQSIQGCVYIHNIFAFNEGIRSPFFKKKPIKLQFDTITPKAWLNHQFHFHFQSVNLSLLYCWLGFQQVFQA